MSAAWRPAWSPATLEFELTVRATSEDVGGPPTPGARAESTFAAVHASWRAPSRDAVSGLVRDARVWTTAFEAPLLQASNVSFSAKRTAGTLAMVTTGAPASACGTADWGYLGWLRDLDLALPDSITVGQQWTDSSTTVVCRDGVALHTSTVRRFHVDSLDRQAGRLVVTRTARVEVSGRAVRGTDTTVVTGRGTGALHYVLDASSVAPVSANGEASLELTARNSANRAAARQTVRLQIARAPAP